MDLCRTIVLLSITGAAMTIPAKAYAQSHGQLLSAEEIRTQVFGRKWRSQLSDGTSWNITIAADGASTSTGVRQGKESTIAGKFFIRDGKLCRFWEGENEGRERCSDATYLNGDKIISVNRSGQVTAILLPRE